ncbi:serine/threonine protein phosphatase [Sphingobium indicum]|uniref:Serine/threonine protein phosphatase n=2 Tax=Sphingobium indicum TaxID=332055 RepID=A0A1L5BN87_SPHIB|nr:metallophosphoesterase family protein [Sphingobium indicum]APL94232.1 serine/threonine protein phosphatase [Sphingobium indicum B90A]KEY97331.1 serine/threonine protein phosphatase [Sphingomonas sp. BHC-A]NYI21223.1 serine/threonine protein phosphatase 1 [Sphingobium indicum]RYM03973.1 serine/threonine protein phosphatase [Sphingobium indicum]
MLMPFRARKAREHAPPPSVGGDRRVYAIGDVHGRDDLLAQLLDRIALDEAGRHPLPRLLILLGDLVDRGPQSRQVVERAMGLARSGEEVRFLKGNHEEMFVAAARGKAQAARLFRRHGGVETLASYGLGPEDSARMSDEAMARWMLAHVPRDHVDFLDDLPDMLPLGDYLFVHAGVRPRVALHAQIPADLRWIRGDFLNHGGRLDKMIVHGHNISADVDVRPNRIGIDTGAFRSGRLTAIGLEGDRRWFLQTGD